MFRTAQSFLKKQKVLLLTVLSILTLYYLYTTYSEAYVDFKKVREVFDEKEYVSLIEMNHLDASGDDALEMSREWQKKSAVVDTISEELMEFAHRDQ